MPGSASSAVDQSPWPVLYDPHQSRVALAAIDPRPDMRDDTERWSRLLLLVAPTDARDPQGLTGTLRYLRCEGATLAPAEAGGYRLLPPPDMWREDVRAMVAEGGHEALLIDLLGRAGERP